MGAKMKREKIGIAMAGGMVAVTVSAGAVLTAQKSFAETTSTDNVAITVPVSCSITASNTEHTASVANGTLVSGIGSTTLKAFCNDTEGFAIYAIGYTGEQLGETVLTDESLGSSHDIATGTVTGGEDSSWAMKLETNASATYPVTLENGYGSYSEVPDEYTLVASRDSATDVGDEATGAVLNSTYQVYIAETQPAGAYIGKVKYTLVHPSDASAPVTPLAESDCRAGYICYAPNAGDIEGSMSSLGTLSASATAGRIGVGTSATSAALIAPNYSRDGYGFAGWSEDFEADETSTIYGPNETITLASGEISTYGKILYPVWVESAGTIQDWTGCSNLTTTSYDATEGTLSASLSSITALTDARDGDTYAVARLADGNCWMIENLRLDAEDSTDSTLAQGFGTSATYGNFVGLAESENTNFTATASATDATEANSLYYAGTQSGTATIDISQTNYAGYRIPRYNGNNTNRELTASRYGTGSSTYYQWHAYGNYYNWPAAMANTGYFTSYSTSDVAGTSICPSGWKLPYGNSSNNGATSGGFSYLDTLMGGSGIDATSSTSPTGAERSVMWRAFPNNFVYSGYWDTSSAVGRGSHGGYWSSSALHSNLSYLFGFGSTYVGPGAYNDNKYYGRSVRCIAES